MRGKEKFADSSGSFCVSSTAAMGIPKLETGPQKSELIDLLVNFQSSPTVILSVDFVMALEGTGCTYE